MPSGGVMPIRSQCWMFCLLRGCSLAGVAHVKSLNQQVFQLQLMMNQIRMDCSIGDRVGVCVESRRANNVVLVLLLGPSLNGSPCLAVGSPFKQESLVKFTTLESTSMTCKIVVGPGLRAPPSLKMTSATSHLILSGITRLGVSLTTTN
jgi:hypothetical protein